jgi:photosynthetic reaction center cytochrome c subunit/tetratricopeptide repeat protein
VKGISALQSDAEVRMIRRCCLFSTAAVPVFVATLLFATQVVRAQDPVAGQRGAGAGRGAAAAGPQNLQVLPKDTPQAQVLQTMQAFTAALGVQCVHCHVQAAAPAGGRGDGGGGRGGRGGGAPAFDYASDDKAQKKAARQMMLMVRDINPKVVAAVGKAEDMTVRVGCVTCHRGVAIPRPLTDILDLTTTEKGAPAAIAQYKDLRKQYFGAQAYDFSEGSLVAYAQRATNANKADEAMAWLQLNLEYFPLSSRTYVGLSQAQQKKNDKEAAIKSMEKAVELDPQNAQTKRQLDQLKGVPAPPPAQR